MAVVGLVQVRKTGKSGESGLVLLLVFFGKDNEELCVKLSRYQN
jgi:hypothetical protein